MLACHFKPALVAMFVALAAVFSVTSQELQKGPALTPNQAGDKKEPDFKVDTSYLEKTWGVKLKSAQYAKPGNMANSNQVKLLLEFTKDVEDTADLKAVLAPNIKLYNWHLFDGDNVLLKKVSAQGIEGEMSGRAGDAFRLTLDFIDDNTYQKARKLEFRADKKK